MKRFVLLCMTNFLFPNLAIAEQGVNSTPAERKHLEKSDEEKINQRMEEIGMEIEEINLDLSALRESGSMKNFEARKETLMNQRKKLKQRVNEPTSIEGLEAKKEALIMERYKLASYRSKLLAPKSNESLPKSRKDFLIEKRLPLVQRQEKISEEISANRDEIFSLEEFQDPEGKIPALEAKVDYLMREGSAIQAKIAPIDKEISIIEKGGDKL